MKKSNVTIQNKGEVGVMVIVSKGQSNFYPYNNICEYMHVYPQFDHATMKIQSFRDREEWVYALLTGENDNSPRYQSRESAIRYMGEDVIEKAEAKCRSNVRAAIRMAKQGQKNPVWLMLKPIADEVVKHYQSDFYYHDAHTIQEQSPQEFLWLCHSTGTWLITHRNPFYVAIIDEELKRERYHDHPEYIYYHFKNGILMPVSFNTAVGIYNRLPA